MRKEHKQLLFRVFGWTPCRLIFVGMEDCTCRTLLGEAPGSWSKYVWTCTGGTDIGYLWVAWVKLLAELCAGLVIIRWWRWDPVCVRGIKAVRWTVMLSWAVLTSWDRFCPLCKSFVVESKIICYPVKEFCSCCLKQRSYVTQWSPANDLLACTIVFGTQRGPAHFQGTWIKGFLTW